MSHTLVTIICPLAHDTVERARDLIEALGNPVVERVHTAFEAVAAEPSIAAGWEQRLVGLTLSF